MRDICGQIRGNKNQAAAVVGTSVLALAGLNAVAKAEPIPFGPISLPQSLGQQQFTINANGDLDVTFSQGQYSINVHTVFDLSGIQQALPAAVKQQANHRDDCGEDIDLHTTRLAPGANGMADLFVAGHYGKWSCPTMNVPQFHGLQVSWAPARLAKTIVVEQSGSVDLVLKPQIVDGGQGITLVIAAREVKADGVLGGILQLPWVGPSLLDPIFKTAILNQINSRLGPGSLHQGLPGGLSFVSPQIVSAKFVDIGGGKLGLDLVMSAHIDQIKAAVMLRQALVGK